MGRRWKITEETDPKARLVREICSLSSAFAGGGCTHRRPRSPGTFVDWYLILRIDDSAGADLVRRRYRHLALQLHPDKNKHPQAEVAFKLVSEAYACLSDQSRRRAYDSERRDTACPKCISRRLRPPHCSTAADEEAAAASDVLHTLNKRTTRPKTGSTHQLRAVEELRARIKEDAMAVENCMRAARKAFRRVDRSAVSPVFDPSDRLLYPDYPHRRIQLVSREIDSYVRAAAGCYVDSKRSGRCESPVYEVGAGSARRCGSKSTF